MDASTVSSDGSALSSSENSDQFRLGTTNEIAQLLHQCSKNNIRLSLNARTGANLSALLWAIDEDRGILSFRLESDHSQLQPLLVSNEATVVGYLSNIQIQFNLNDLVLVHGASDSVLSAAFPQEIFRFQRRNFYRVRPLLRHSPLAKFRHPMMPDMQLSLRLVDVSMGGCALLVPEDIPAFSPGITLNGAQIYLDTNTHFTARLRLQYATTIDAPTQSLRLGCEWVELSAEIQRDLQIYIDQTQRKWRLLPSAR